MLVVVPVLVAWKLRQRHSKQQEEKLFDDNKTPVATGPREVLSIDKETRSILRLAIPYTISSLASSACSNVCLILVSQHIGTKPVAAFALVQVLAGLTDGTIQGPMYASTDALCPGCWGREQRPCGYIYTIVHLTVWLVQYSRGLVLVVLHVRSDIISRMG